MMLPRNIADWPEPARYQFYERLNIMEFDGRLDPTVAAVKAERDVRRQHGEIKQENLFE